MNKWVILNKKLNIENKKLRTEKIVNVLLSNRGLKTKKEIDNFLNPKLSDLTIDNAGIDRKEIDKSVKRIKRAIEDKEQIIVFGDYDVDGICGSAILWEKLNDLGAKVLPYIPHRTSEGYGLSEIGIKNILIKHPDTSLIITVDNGIVANKAVESANKNNIDVIITDHHVPSAKLPKAFSIVHTTSLCGTGVAYMLSKQLKTKNEKRKTGKEFDHLSLVSIATVADLVPLMGLNRVFLKFGLDELRKTKRQGLLALIKESAIEQKEIGIYEIGHILGPRINAMGRLELAMDSLRLLCTNDKKSSEALAKKLSITNQKRKDITIESFGHAKTKVRKEGKLGNIIITGDPSYQPGVIGLIASRLVEEFYRPSIVFSIGEKFSKASARSIAGFNIIEFIRKASDLLVDAGGHPMAAGFTIETSKMKQLKQKLEKLAENLITLEMLERTMRIDAEILLEDVNSSFYDELLKLSPVGVKNPQPVFLTKNLLVSEMRLVGIDKRHVAFKLISFENKSMDAIAFNLSEKANDIRIGDRIDVVYAIDKETWRGVARFKLKLRDFKK
ncbi:MAG: single-stranded-DNA-specific exonuclease RecJ [Patescibacteria group bacterium]